MIRNFITLLLAVFALNAFAAADANQGTRADLETVKGIGPGLSSKILEARKAGQFKDWGDLVERVGGIGNARFVKMLENHKSRGVDIRMIEFRTAPPIGEFRSQLERAQIPVIVRQYEVAGNEKFCIIDDRIVVTGDWAWEEPAGTVQPDATVTIFRDCGTVSRRYRDNFEFMSKPRPGDGPESAKGQP